MSKDLGCLLSARLLECFTENEHFVISEGISSDWYFSVSSRSERWTQSESSNLAEYLCPIPCSTDAFPWYSHDIPHRASLNLCQVCPGLRCSRSGPCFPDSEGGEKQFLGRGMKDIILFFVSEAQMYMQYINSYAVHQDGSQRWDLWEVNRSWGQSPQEWD